MNICKILTAIYQKLLEFVLVKMYLVKNVRNNITQMLSEKTLHGQPTNFTCLLVVNCSVVLRQLEGIQGYSVLAEVSVF